MNIGTTITTYDEAAGRSAFEAEINRQGGLSFDP